MQGAWGEKRDPGVGLSVEAAGLWAFGSECPDRCRLNAEAAAGLGGGLAPTLPPGSEGDA